MRNAEELRQSFAQAVLHVRSGRATSRRALAALMRLSPTTAGFYADQLIGSAYLRESGLEQGRMGRPQRTLSTVAEAGWFAGLEFNAERVRGVRVDFSGKLAAGELRSLPEKAENRTVMAELKGTVSALARGATGPLLGIGIGAPGVVDPGRGVGVDYAFLPDWQETPIAGPMKKRFGAPVTLENNLRAIAWAERWFGGAQELADFVILGPRSGFGVAIVHGGRIMSGVHDAAGEVGHWLWPDQAGAAHLHDHLSSPAVWRRLAGATTHTPTPADLRAALSAYAGSASEEWHAVVRDYARVLASLQLLLDTGVYFLHGPLTALGERFCQAVFATAPEVAPSLRNRPFALQASALGDDAGALGAASLAMENWRPE